MGTVAPPQTRPVASLHGDKGQCTNDCYQLKRQLEAALESGKLSHLVKDVKQRGNTKGRQQGKNNGKVQVINMVWAKGDNRKRKSRMDKEEDWMNAPITFPSMYADDVSNEPLIIEAEVEGYLVRRVFVDQGAVVQVMVEHCFDSLSPSVRARLTSTQTETMIKFTVVRASSPYNIILGQTGMRELRAISSTIHAMMKYPTPRGIATLVARTISFFECRRLEKGQTAQEGEIKEEKPISQEKPKEEEILVTPAFPEQRVTIGT
ncbi:hypothetical protein Tco_0670475 [Tanacetum coccineum]